MTGTPIPFEQILQKAEHYKADMTRFLRDMIAIPSESADEKRVVLRIKQEMEAGRLRQGRDRPDGQRAGHHRARAAPDRDGRAHRHRRRRQPEELDLRPLPGHGGRRADRRPRRVRPGGRHGLDGLCRQDHQGPRAAGRVHAARHRHRAGGRLRRPVLAVPDRADRTSAPSSSSAPSRPTARSTAATAGAWRSASTCRAAAATARRRSAATTRSSRWRRS